MTKGQLLWAWAVPGFASGSPVDHTWVTTYDNRKNAYPNVTAVIGANESYWYCWGSFHPKGGTPNNQTGYLGSQLGDLGVAQCLVKPNANSTVDTAARGTIFTYGEDGVCHQLANQVLYATSLGGVAPLTVNNARGYRASTFIYGTYGLQHAAWANKINVCTPKPFAAPIAGQAMIKPQDDFEAHARSVLGPEREHLLTKLLALRDELHAQRADVLALRTGQPLTAEAINARNQQIFAKAAALLGPENFTKVFGFSPDQKIDLVDQTIMKDLNAPR
jgi:hypothetical protein